MQLLSPVCSSDISKYNTAIYAYSLSVIVFVVAYLVFTYTGLGSRLKAISAGEAAARFAGIRVETTKDSRIRGSRMYHRTCSICKCYQSKVPLHLQQVTSWKHRS